jgi:acyl-CoA thioesterase YciA
MQVGREPTIRVMLLPKDTNGYGTIFGGVIMSHLDLAGAAEARRHTRSRVVTVAIDRVEFIAPVFVGDVVSYYTKLNRVGTSSLHVDIEVEAERGETGERVRVTEARVVYVAVDADGRPTPAREA